MKTDYIKWDEYFMGLALLSSNRSKDPNTCVGACIVNDDNYILSIGYNGLPVGCKDNLYPWEVREGSLEETKYAYVVHAEMNAILNTKTNLKDSTIYVTLFPCNECAKAIIQSGIKKVIYMDDKYNNTPSNIAAKKMFDEAGIKYEQYNKTGKEVIIKL